MDICDNSLNATNGSLFVAIVGNAANGTKYIGDAISRGAKYIVSEENNPEISNPKIQFLHTKNARQELAYIASHFWKSDLQDIVAVTGTNGKSSTVDIVLQIWTFAQRKAVSIGTLGLVDEGGNRHKLAGTLTCPPAITLHKIFHSLSETSDAERAEKSQKYSVALEASSHGICQHRLDYIPFSVCAFTNFSQDHLDYHQTMDQYWAAKERLFLELSETSTKFVVNADDPKAEKIREIARNRKIYCIDYGYKAHDICILETHIDREHRQKITVLFLGEKFTFSLPLFGKFQIYNALCAAGICYLTGIKIETVIEALESICSINGRLELVAEKLFEMPEKHADQAVSFGKAQIFIDYAHTPDALKNSILSLLEYHPKRLITLFGCGGNRDHDKRKIMGEIAVKLSDFVIVTDDNPREESPAEIRKMILEGCQTEALQKVAEIGDRRKAIEYAIDMLQDGDILLIAGKGHETYQQIGAEFIHFDDKEIVLNAIEVLNKKSENKRMKCE